MRLHFQQNPADGWYKLLTAEEGEFYNVPVPDEGTDLVQLKSQMRVSNGHLAEHLMKHLQCKNTR